MNNLLFICVFCSLFQLSISSSIRGIHPKLQSFYSGEIFTCLDQSKNISISQVNDGYCDCADGSDEPGTSACPNGKFWCSNPGFKGYYIESSRVDDGIIDCCDGSDEATLTHPSPSQIHKSCSQFIQQFEFNITNRLKEIKKVLKAKESYSSSGNSNKFQKSLIDLKKKIEKLKEKINYEDEMHKNKQNEKSAPFKENEDQSSEKEDKEIETETSNVDNEKAGEKLENNEQNSIQNEDESNKFEEANNNNENGSINEDIVKEDAEKDMSNSINAEENMIHENEEQYQGDINEENSVEQDETEFDQSEEETGKEKTTFFRRIGRKIGSVFQKTNRAFKKLTNQVGETLFGKEIFDMENDSEDDFSYHSSYDDFDWKQSERERELKDLQSKLKSWENFVENKSDQSLMMCLTHFIDESFEGETSGFSWTFKFADKATVSPKEWGKHKTSSYFHHISNSPVFEEVTGEKEEKLEKMIETEKGQKEWFMHFAKRESEDYNNSPHNLSVRLKCGYSSDAAISSWMQISEMEYQAVLSLPCLCEKKDESLYAQRIDSFQREDWNENGRFVTKEWKMDIGDWHCSKNFEGRDNRVVFKSESYHNNLKKEL